VLALVDTAEMNFRGWVDALSREGRVTPEPRALHAAIAAVERELPGSPPPAPVPATPSNVIELSRPAPQGPSLVPATQALELIELPELGSRVDADGPRVTSEAAIAETIEMVDVPVHEGLVPRRCSWSRTRGSLAAGLPPAARPSFVPATIAESDDIDRDVTLAIAVENPFRRGRPARHHARE
jgi:hypothetical protein